MYPKIKKYKQQNLFNNKLTMPEKGRYFHVASVLMLANWGRNYGVKNVSMCSKDGGLTFKVFVEFQNGRKWHSRCIPNRGKNDTALALYRYLFALSEASVWPLINVGNYVNYQRILQDRFRRLKKLLKKSDIH